MTELQLSNHPIEIVRQRNLIIESMGKGEMDPVVVNDSHRSDIGFVKQINLLKPRSKFLVLRRLEVIANSNCKTVCIVIFSCFLIGEKSTNCVDFSLIYVFDDDFECLFLVGLSMKEKKKKGQQQS